MTEFRLWTLLPSPVAHSIWHRRLLGRQCTSGATNSTQLKDELYAQCGRYRWMVDLDVT